MHFGDCIVNTALLDTHNFIFSSLARYMRTHAYIVLQQKLTIAVEINSSERDFHSDETRRKEPFFETHLSNLAKNIKKKHVFSQIHRLYILLLCLT